MSLMLVPILIGGLAYLYVAQHNKISIKKKYSKDRKYEFSSYLIF